MSPRQLADIKRTLNDGRQKFERLVRLFPQNQVDNRSVTLLNDWQTFIDDDAKITELSSVENFQSICGIGSKFSNRQNYAQLITTAVSGFAEIDLAVHIVRERRGAAVKKLPEVAGSRQCDFYVATSPVLLVESKYIEHPTARKVESVLTNAAEQVIETAQQQSLASYDGSVWAFSYRPAAGLDNMQLQQLITDITNRFRPQVNGTLRMTLQVYAPGAGAGLYGDSCL